MTGWRCAAILGNADAIQTYWRLKTNVDSGPVRGGAARRRAALDGPRERDRRDERDLRAPARPGGRRAARHRGRGRAAQGHDLRLGAGARRATPRPRSPSWCSRRRPSSSRRARCTARRARGSSGSRSPLPTSGSPRRSSGCASTSRADVLRAPPRRLGIAVRGALRVRPRRAGGRPGARLRHRADLAGRLVRPRSRRPRCAGAARSSSRRSRSSARRPPTSSGRGCS